MLARTRAYATRVRVRTCTHAHTALTCTHARTKAHASQRQTSARPATAIPCPERRRGARRGRPAGAASVRRGAPLVLTSARCHCVVAILGGAAGASVVWCGPGAGRAATAASARPLLVPWLIPVFVAVNIRLNIVVAFVVVFVATIRGGLSRLADLCVNGLWPL